MAKSSISVEEFSRLNEQFVNTRSELYNKQDEIAKIQKKNAQLNKQLQSRSQTIKRLNEIVARSGDTRALVDENRALKKSLQNMSEEQATKMEALNSSFNQIVLENEEMSNKLKAAKESAKTTATATSSEDKEELERLREEVRHLTAVAASQPGDILFVNTKKDDKPKDAEESEKALKEQREALEKESKALEDARAEIKKLKQELQQSETDNTTVIQSLTQKSVEIDRLKDKLKVAEKNDTSLLQEKLDKAIEDKQDLRKRYQELFNKAKTIKQRNVDLREKLKALDANVSTTNEETELRKSQMSQLQESFATITGDLKASDLAKRELEETVKTQKEQIAKLTAENQELESKHKKLDTVVVGKAQDIDELNKNLANVEDSHKRLKEENEAHVENIKAVKEEHEQTKKALEELHSQHKEKGEAHEQLSVVVADLKAELATTQEKLASSEEKKTVFEEKIVGLENEKAELTRASDEQFTQFSETIAKQTEELISLREKVESLQRKIQDSRVQFKATQKNNERLIKELKRKVEAHKNAPPTPAPAAVAAKTHNGNNKRSPDAPPVARVRTTKSNDAMEELGEVLHTLQEENIRLKEQVQLIGHSERKLRLKLDKQSKLIKQQAMMLPSGRLTAEMESNKLTKRKDSLINIFGGSALDSQVAQKSSDIMQETLLKNMQLKEDIETLGDEVELLTEQNEQLKKKIKGCSRRLGRENI